MVKRVWTIFSFSRSCPSRAGCGCLAGVAHQKKHCSLARRGGPQHFAHYFTPPPVNLGALFVRGPLRVAVRERTQAYTRSLSLSSCPVSARTCLSPCPRHGAKKGEFKRAFSRVSGMRDQKETCFIRGISKLTFPLILKLHPHLCLPTHAPAPISRHGGRVRSC